MFDARRGLFGLVSLTVHAGIIAGALHHPVRAANTPPPPDTIFISYRAPASPQPPRAPDVPVVSGPSDPPLFPVDVVPGIPPIDSTPGYGVGNPEQSAGPLIGTDSQTATGLYSVSAVEEPPEILAGLPLRYPELLRQAGIEGRVLVEAVVDTLGKAESGSLRVVTSSHPGFERAALDGVARAVFRPGRVSGRAVRVLVLVPVAFRLRR